jgi:ethanolamine permease
VTIAATFELFVTLLAIFELLVFMGWWRRASRPTSPRAAGPGPTSFPRGDSRHLRGHSLRDLVLPCHRGVAMAAEEAKDPKRSIPIAYTAGILTLVVLAMGVMVFAGGVGDWTKLANINDPLPQAMKTIVGESSGWLHMLVWLGLFGLVASFHGIILGYSRQIYAQARSGYLPAWFAEVHPRFKTPHRAIVAGGVVGIAAIFSDELLSFGGQSLTANIVTMAVLGALLMYVLSMAALFKLRASEPGLPRPYRVPFYPIFPAVALIGAVICLVTVAWFNPCSRASSCSSWPWATGTSGLPTSSGRRFPSPRLPRPKAESGWLDPPCASSSPGDAPCRARSNSKDFFTSAERWQETAFALLRRPGREAGAGSRCGRSQTKKTHDLRLHPRTASPRVW